MTMGKTRLLLIVGLLALFSLVAAGMGMTKVPATSLAAPALAEPEAYVPPPPGGQDPGTGIWLIPAGSDAYGGENPAIYGHVGEFQVYPWYNYSQPNYSLEWGEGDYGSARIENWVNDSVAARGLKAGFGITPYNGRKDGGIAIPPYLRDNPNAVVNAGTAEDPWLIPKYWSDEYKRSYDGLVQNIAYRLRDDADKIAFIVIGTGIYGEIAAADWWASTDIAALVDAGFNSDLWIDTVQWMTERWIHWLSGGTGESPITLLQQVAPFTVHSRERREISRWSASQGIGLSINGLVPQQGGAVRPDGLAMYDAILGWWDEVPISFETYHYMLCDPREFYWGMISGLDKHVDYLRLSESLFIESEADDGTNGPDRALYLQTMRRFAPYIGATMDGDTPQDKDTPGIWVALRAPLYDYWVCMDRPRPQDWELQTGNFNFWLYQDNNIPGGKTVAETNDELNDRGEPYWKIGGNVTAPFNPDLPAPDAAKPPWQWTDEDWTLFTPGWMIRRTDQDTGNPYMWLKVDDDYINGGWNAVAVTVTYADIFTDTWSLEYEAIGGHLRAAVPEGSSQPWVQKSDSKTYKTVTFLIDDARLANGLDGGADLRINCNSDGNDWIHFVELKWLATQAEPPTPTPTPTETPTPTMTPTPSTGWVRGIVWEDTDEDGGKDPEEAGIEGVEVALKAMPSMSVIAAQSTAPDGTFDFGSVEPGNYILQQTDLPQYASTTPNMRGITVFANEEQFVAFGDYALPTPTPTATETPTETPTATHTPTPTLTPTATPRIITTYLPLSLR